MMVCDGFMMGFMVYRYTIFGGLCWGKWWFWVWNIRIGLDEVTFQLLSNVFVEAFGFREYGIGVGEGWTERKKSSSKSLWQFPHVKVIQWEDAIVTGWCEALSDTYTLENWHGTWKSPVWQENHLPNLHCLVPCWVLGGVRIIPNYSISQISSIAGCFSAQAEGKLPIPASPRCLGAQLLDENYGKERIFAAYSGVGFEPLGLFKIKTYFFNRIAINTHRIHVWYIYLHLVDFYGKCSQIYVPYMDTMG